MVAGDSQQFTVVITGLASGLQQITFQLTGTQEVSTSTTTVDIDVTASFSETKSNSQTLLYSSIGIILVAVILLGILFAHSKKESGVISPVQKTLPSVVQQQPAVMCWSCHGPITGPMQGCPSCGARYHTKGVENCDADRLDACTNCGASVELFVLA
jgi:ABC-type proline/glycine betaine transport system permease subunit